MRYRRCAEIRQQYEFAIVTVLVWGTLLGAGALQPVFVHAETRVIPSVIASERYDTNIYFAPADRLPPGTRLSDFVTGVGGGVQLLHNTRDIEASLTGGADVNEYVYNKGLSYVTTRVDGYAILNGWVEQLARGAKLRVLERFRYTPESPGFLTGVGGGPTADDPFLRGIQSFRANTFTETVSADGSYPIVRGLALQGGYSFSTYRVGSILAATTAGGASFFNTEVNQWSVGPQYQITQEDSISLSYQQTLITQKLKTGSTSNIDTNAQTLFATYATVMPDWRFGVSGGVALIEPANKVFPAGSITFSINPERSTTLLLDLSRRAAPSFFIVAGALISNVGQVQITHRLSDLLTLVGSVSYALNEIVPQETTKFKTLTTSVGLNYKLTRTMAVDFYYNYTDYKTEQPVASFNYQIQKNVVGLSLTAQWK